MSYRLLVILIAVTLLLGLSCGAPQPKGEVIVYVAAPLSGFQANGGQTVAGGVRLMAEEINKAGGLLGYTVKVVALDDESDSEVAVDVAQQIQADLEAGKRIIGVVGHYNSGQTLAAMEIYKDLPLVVITPTASEVSLTRRGYRNFFRVNANDAVQAQVDAQFLVQRLGARRVAIVHNDTEYGIGLRDEMTRALSALGAEVVVTLQVAEGQATYTSEVARIRQAGPDAVFYAGYEIEAPYLRAELVAAGVEVPLLASDGAFLSATIDEAQGAAEGMYISAFAPSPTAVADRQWVRAYQEVEYRNPDTYSINGYSAMQVLVEGVKKAGSFDVGKVINGLHQLNLNTLVGRVAYDDNGDLREPQIYIFQVQGGEFVQVFPEP